MNQLHPRRVNGPEHLSVIHRASHPQHNGSFHLQDVIIQTDLQFNITGWNAAAELLHGSSGAMGKNLFELIDLEFITGSLENLKTDLAVHHCWSGEVIFKRYNGQQICFRSTASYIISDNDQPIGITFANHNITDIRNKEQQMAETEKEYATLVNTLFDGVIMFRADGTVGACNKRASEILGLSEDELMKKATTQGPWKAIREDGSEFPLEKFPAMMTLQTGLAQRNTIMGLQHPDGSKTWLQVNSQGLFHPGETKPHAAVVSFSDITDKLKSEEALRKSNERFYYAGKVTSDAIWDLDLETNEIYRSEAFCSFSGYSIKEIQPNLDWWINKVHPDDKDRVRNKVNEAIQLGIANWKDEYRFQCADGNYKYLLDSGIILYRNGMPVRIIGAIQDLTERKELEARLLHEEIQKQKIVNQASLAAQEQERDNISKELHDNVNQILMSAKLFMSTAQKNPSQSEELLGKAIEYQMLALEEIRRLSKSLSTSLIKTVGLKASIQDIVHNMIMLEQLDVEFRFNSRLEDKLSNEQKLMVYRIIQEQTSNIIKYAEAKNVQILINENNDTVHLVISDDGKGFDPKQKLQGIGFTNVFSRADAYNGKISIISSPGNGCTLELKFPIQA